jgi:hypothetical protein
VNARLNAWAMALRQTPGVVNTTAALVNPEPFNDGVARLHRTRSTGENPGIDISTALHRGFLEISPSGVVAIPRVRPVARVEGETDQRLALPFARSPLGRL